MPSQIESYQKVIDLIAKEHFFYNAKDILLRIAKLHPQIVVDAYNVTTSGNCYGVTDAVVQLLLAREKIEAIKRYRQDYACSLKEAKDAVYDVIDSHENLRVMYYPEESCKTS